MKTSRIEIAFVVIMAIPIMLLAQQQPTALQQGSPVVSVPGSVPAANTDVPSQQAVAVKEVESPAAPTHFGDQAIWSLMVSFAIQYLKRSPWFGWITPTSSARLKTQFGFLMAVLTAAGIHFAVSGSVLDGGGASITVSGLSMNAFKDIAWQWASQQAWYRLVVKEPREIAVVNNSNVTKGPDQP